MSIAFFDFDKTLVNVDSGPEFGQYLFELREAKVMERAPAGKAKRRALGLRMRYMPYVTWMGVQSALYKMRATRRSSVVRNAYKGLRGVPQAVIEREMGDFVDEELYKHIYPKMLETIKAHQQNGVKCVVITTGMRVLIERALDHFPPDMDLFGCELEVVDGKVTGNVTGPLYGQDKANIMAAYAKGRGVDLADCFAYTDHYSDHHMLEAVGTGTCINPRGRLRALAEKRGWAIWDLPNPLDRRDETVVSAKL